MKRRVHQIQVSIQVEKPRNVGITRELLNAALHYRATMGEDPLGFHIRMITWYVNGREHLYEGDKEVTDALNAMFRMGLQPRFQTMGTRKGMEPSSLDVD